MIPTYRITVRSDEKRILEEALKSLKIHPHIILDGFGNEKGIHDFFVLLTHEQATYIRLACNAERFINVDESIKKRTSCASITQ